LIESLIDFCVIDQPSYETKEKRKKKKRKKKKRKNRTRIRCLLCFAFFLSVPPKKRSMEAHAVHAWREAHASLLPTL
jgi:hypothetical protein